VVSNEKLERSVALLDNGVLEEYDVEREGDNNIVGGLFKGTVKNIEPGLKAMFVISSKDIPSIYPIGSEIMIQVSKGSIGNKGPRVTTNISLAGRYLVLMPFSEQFGISRKIDEPKERQRLRHIMQKLKVPEGMGIIMRTVAQGQRSRHFVRDLAMLLEQWHDVEEKRDNNPAPISVFREPGLLEKTARDFLTDEVDQIMIRLVFNNRSKKHSLVKFGSSVEVISLSMKQKH